MHNIVFDLGGVVVAWKPDELVARGAQRTGIAASTLRAFVESVPASLVPDPVVVDLMHRLRAGGSRLYCLSNMPAISIEYLDREHGFWHLFEGVVISSRVRACKPEPAIYGHLLTTHGLRPAETIFVDDMVVNLQAAERLQIRTVHFRSAEQCGAELRQLMGD